MNPYYDRVRGFLSYVAIYCNNGRVGNWINHSLLKLAMTSKTHMKSRIRSDDDGDDDHDHDR